MPMFDDRFAPGQRVRITQQIPRLSGPLRTTFEGTVLRYGQQKTGSWFAHSKDHKLWLDRLELRMDDGEIVVCNLDQYTVVEVIDEKGSGDGSGGGDGGDASAAQGASAGA